ncbi:dihydrofolate reductase family protein [Variovorax sp. M-6]|uniref:dihydrofolate reductase family protein n=1 Tax=Variovorax sp. M-6 TaxID=3233041 RepID=UPI003F957646
MRKLTVFNNVSLDGYFTDARGDMGWAHKSDPEWTAFTRANAGQGGMLLFGRVTYEQMASYWPTPAAAEAMPEVARAMNAAPKLVFSTTLKEARWQNTRLIESGMLDAVRALKNESGPNLVVMGSGKVVAQLAGAKLVDEFQLVLNPLVLGAGRTLFEGIVERIALQLTDERRFRNGNVVLHYRTAH